MITGRAEKLVESDLEVETFISRIERKGIPFREFLAAKNAQGILPRFQINLDRRSADLPILRMNLKQLKKADEEAQKAAAC